jgi:murein DD-endopeptidase MepM/ murein hydrolase activator NlpD
MTILKSKIVKHFSSKTKILSNFIKVFLILTLFISQINGVFASATTEKKLEIEYNEKKETIENQIDTISKTLDDLAKNQVQAQSRTSTLSGQVSNIRSEQNRVDRLIFETRVVVQQIEKEIDSNQSEIDSLSGEVRDILREMQVQRQNNFFKIFLTSENLGNALNEMYNLSSINERLDSKRRQIEESNQKLAENKKQNEAIKDQLEKSRSLLRSKESNLTVLLSETQGEESKYSSLLSSIENQKQELEAQLGGIEGEYLAEIQTLQQEGFQEEYDENANCSFEDKRRIRTDEDYFTKPADGWLTQKFHCGHDGVDIANSIGANIYSIAEGTVERIGPNNNGCIGLRCNGGFGNYILVRHDLPSNQTIYSLYAHLNKVSTKQIGEQLEKGEVIGEMGCTGYTKPFPCGSHLHFVILSDTYEVSGLGCRLGGSTCLDPQKYIKGI